MMLSLKPWTARWQLIKVKLTFWAQTCESFSVGFGVVLDLSVCVWIDCFHVLLEAGSIFISVPPTVATQNLQLCMMGAETASGCFTDCSVKSPTSFLFLCELIFPPPVGRDWCGEPHHRRSLPPQVRSLQLLLQRRGQEGENNSHLSLLQNSEAGSLYVFHASHLYSVSLSLIFGAQTCKVLQPVALLSFDNINIVCTLCAVWVEPSVLCVQSDVRMLLMQERLFETWF